MNKFFRERQWIFLIIWGYLLILCALFPYLVDDWRWGTEIGWRDFTSFFRDYNGRYISNTLSVFFARSPLFKTIAMASILTGIIYLIVKSTRVFGKDSSKMPIVSATLFSFILLFLCPMNMFKQTIAWSSGFSIYVIGAFMITLDLYWLFEKVKKPSAWTAFLSFILAFSSSLFVENITLGLFGFSFLSMAVSLFRKKKPSRDLIFFFIGSLCGTLFMFSNSAYGILTLDHADPQQYRKIHILSLKSTLISIRDNYFNVIYKDMVFNYPVLNSLIWLFSIRLFLISSNSFRTVHQLLARFVFIGQFIFLFYCWFTFITPANSLFGAYGKYIEGSFSTLYFVSLFFSLRYSTNENWKDRSLFYQRCLRRLILCILLSIPLVIASPLSGRIFFPTYVLLSAICIDLFVENWLLAPDNGSFKIVVLPLITACAFFLATVFLWVYGNIYYYDKQRVEYVMDLWKNGETDISLPALPFDQFIIPSDPVSDWMTDYKCFYHIDQNINLRNMSFDEWLEKINE